MHKYKTLCSLISSQIRVVILTRKLTYKCHSNITRKLCNPIMDEPIKTLPVLVLIYS